VTINLAAGPVVALIAGILILIVPRLLNYIVAIYLILIGLIGIFAIGNLHTRTEYKYSSAPRVDAVCACQATVVRPASSESPSLSTMRT
jgi:Protein of unknown function (DUF3096)